MDLKFLQSLTDMDNDRATLYIQWDTMEKIQDATPNVEWGWGGFNLMLFYRYGDI